MKIGTSGNSSGFYFDQADRQLEMHGGQLVELTGKPLAAMRWQGEWVNQQVHFAEETTLVINVYAA